MNREKRIAFDPATGKLTAGDMEMVLRPYAGAELCRPGASPGEWLASGSRWRWETKRTETGIALRLRGESDHDAPGSVFGWRATADVELSHALSLGARMGRCKSLLFPGEPGRELRSTSATMLTRNDEYLFFAAPLRNPAWSVFIGTTTAAGLRDFRLECTIPSDLDKVADTGWIEASIDGDPYERMREWARRNATVKKDFSSPLTAGWNTWDYYRWTVTEEEVLKNAEFVARDPVLSRYVKRIIVDDGWQYCYGEWEANPLFPHGMKFLADRLADMGFEPGLWFAPTMIEPHCRLAQLHGELMAMSAAGQPCLAAGTGGRQCFVLDPTLPEVQRLLRDLFARYAEMGYKYFKLDFMAATLAAARFHDATVSRTEIPRLIVQAAHAGCAGRAHILGCNYYYCGGNEFVDSVRICTDIHARWESIRINAVSAAAQFHHNGVLWQADPDFALARGPETSDDPEMHRLNPCWTSILPDSPFNERAATYSLATATRSELEIWLSLVLVSGGVINLSDDLTKLNASGLELLRRTVSAVRGRNGMALDLFTSELPGFWRQDLPDGGRRVLAINWSGEPCLFDVAPALAGGQWRQVRDFWRDAAVNMNELTRSFTLSPHHCRMFELKR